MLAHAHHLAWIPAQKAGNEMFVKTVSLAWDEKPWFSSDGPADLRSCCHRVWQAHAWYFRCDQLCVSSPACLASVFCQRPGHGEVKLVPFFTLCRGHQGVNREEFVSVFVIYRSAISKWRPQLKSRVSLLKQELVSSAVLMSHQAPHWPAQVAGKLLSFIYYEWVTIGFFRDQFAWTCAMIWQMYFKVEFF